MCELVGFCCVTVEDQFVYTLPELFAHINDQIVILRDTCVRCDNHGLGDLGGRPVLDPMGLFGA